MVELVPLAKDEEIDLLETYENVNYKLMVVKNRDGKGATPYRYGLTKRHSRCGKP